tara:strand:- start:30845 stop:31429 length:585 start_codon:yes stop_codon:yes gene_type:complete
MIRNILCTVLLSILTLVGFATEHDSVLVAPNNWIAEIIPFPLGFAREIEFTGIEDLRFAPHWSDSTSEAFWTYAFVWYIDQIQPMTEESLTHNFNLYYDGLMGVNDAPPSGNQPNSKLEKTITTFHKTPNGFTGEMRVYDRFFTKHYMTLYIQVTQRICAKTKKQIIRCNISPKQMSHSIWNIFKNVTEEVNCP